LAFVAGIYLISKAYEAYQNEASAAEKAARTLADAQEDIAKESAKEVTAIQQNIAVLKSDVTSKETRKAAIEDLKRAYPDYLKGMDLEKASVSELTSLQNKLTDSVIRSIAERRKATAQEDVTQKIITATLELQRLEKELATQPKDVARRQGLSAAASDLAPIDLSKTDQTVLAIKRKKDELSGLNQEFEAVGNSFDKAFNLNIQSGVTATADAAKKLGDESETAGKKIAGLSSSSKKAKDEINEQAGSVGALREQISKLQKQIDATNPDSPALSSLVKRLDETKKKLKEAEQALLASTFKSLFGREISAPTISDNQPDLAVVPELAFEPDAKEKLIQDGIDAKQAVEAALGAIEIPINADVDTEKLTEAEKKFREQQEKGDKERADSQAATEQKAFEEKQALEEQVKEAAISAAETTAGAVFEIERNNADRQLEAKLAALDLETKNKIDAAGGNKTKIAAIEKDAAKKRQAIEEEGAKKRQQIALKEAVINTALAIVKALPNFVLAGLAGVAGLAQIAVIKSNEFWDGGVAGVDELIGRAQNMGLNQGHKIERLQPGIITAKQNAPRTAHGDTVLAYLSPGEMVLNERQQNTLRSMYGQDAFALAGVPGESSTRRRSLPRFASGGVVGIVPQNGFASQVSTQAVTVDAKAEFSTEQVDAIGKNMGGIIAAEVSRQLRVGLAEGLFDANRRLEREEVLQQNRQG